MNALEIKIGIVLLIGIILVQCKKDDETNETTPTGIETMQVDPDFDFSMQRSVDLNFTTYSNIGEPLKNVLIKVYDSDPSDEEGTKPNLLYKGFTDNSGHLQKACVIPNHLDKVYVSPVYVGLPQAVAINVSSQIDFIFGGAAPNRASIRSTSSSKFLVSDFLYLGDWDDYGLPDYLETIPDIVDQGLLDDINTSLPEQVSGGIPTTHPEFLSAETNIILDQDAEVWVTFVHEGAGYKNVLGYFTYEESSPPSSASEIENLTIIFPNASYLNSGGSLSSGDKVQLKYYDTSLEDFVTTFPAGTAIGWFLGANAFSSGTINETATRMYSIPEFNPESTADKRQHNVLLYDAGRHLVLVGFEDMNRDYSSDNDFNDAVFYASSSPVSAIRSSNMEEIETNSPDTDGDEITDNVDDYPNDPNLAYKNYYPNEDMYGTLAFEDLWPAFGDYDFNDMVIDYQYISVNNPENNIVSLEMKFILRAIGASYNNGFGVELGVSPDFVESVSGYNVNGDLVSLMGNGLEADQSKATIIAFENASDVLAVLGSTTGVNTTIGATYSQPDTMTIIVTFTEPIDPYLLGSAPYNPFLIINQDREKEVHLPDKAPTDLCNAVYFGTSQDHSVLEQGIYYKNQINLPWAINIPYSFEYPYEKTLITNAYLKFREWAESSGNSYRDWYLDKSGYRNNSYIYTHN
ncbi:MAG: LruC domain-containing protein [Bacteroidales bacterium]|nr:LruC domain-containing protein [Bacteroidales bacterium]